MDQEKTFNEDYFIQFGSILTKEKRKQLVNYWKDKTRGVTNKVRRQLQKYTSIIDDIFENKFRAKTIQESSNVQSEIKSNIFKGFEKLGKDKISNHPYKEEEIDLIHWRGVKPDKFLESSNDYFRKVHEYYSKEEYNTSFFQSKIEDYKEITEKELYQDNTNENLEIDVLCNQIVDRWDGLLSKKKDQWFLDQLDAWRSEALEGLYERFDKMEEMMNILSAFEGELGRFWDLSKGSWVSQGFDILKHYANLIENQPEIQQLAEYLGRMQGERDELIEELIQITDFRVNYKVETAVQEEIVGVHESNDINHLIPSELSLLHDKTVETLFYLKFAESKLLTYNLQGTSEVEEEIDEERLEEREKKEEESGPIIICVDTSGSMHGVPERIAKTLCFAILRIALLQDRHCYLISFSTGINTMELTDFQSNLPGLINFLSHSFHGGTDPTPALREAVSQVKTESYKNADVLMISDFIMNTIGGDLVQQINVTKENDVEYHSLVISKSGNKKALEIFDNNWFYEIGAEKPFKNILENLEKINLQ